MEDEIRMFLQFPLDESPEQDENSRVRCMWSGGEWCSSRSDGGHAAKAPTKLLGELSVGPGGFLWIICRERFHRVHRRKRGGMPDIQSQGASSLRRKRTLRAQPSGISRRKWFVPGKQFFSQRKEPLRKSAPADSFADRDPPNPIRLINEISFNELMRMFHWRLLEGAID